MKAFLYVLADPRTGEVRYVGMTGNPKRRIQDHINRKKSEISGMDCR